jgi:uncharacterized protein (DUF58 family)
MLTPRGWWLLTVAVLAALLGVPPAGQYAPAVPILGLTVLLWVAVEWVLFTARLRAAAGRIDVTREIVQGGRTVQTAWAGAPCTVRVTVTLRGGWRLPLVFLADRVPEGRRARGGDPARAVELWPGEPAVIEYELTPRGPGVLRFEGVELRVADLAGFFYRRLFARAPADVLVLPPLVDDAGHRRADKRFNTLPPPGVHRLRRPGSGSELLDLRDYRPGDPPKMIAWKASARRDRLITKEFESEVPVRCVLFLDTSQGVRLGPPGETPLCRLVEVASGVAQAAGGNRDLVGLTTFDEESAAVMPPARTSAHTVRMLGKMAGAAALLPDPGGADANQALKLAYPVARDLYPDLLDADLNARPWGMYWKPLLDARWGWVVPLVMALPLLVFKREVAELLARVAFSIGGRGRVLMTLLILIAAPVVLGGLFWLAYGVRGFLAPHAPRTRRRKQLAAVFAALDADTPGAIERYLRDDEAFCARAGRFQADHHVRAPVSLYDAAGRYRFRGEAKADVLAAAMMRSVARARDNELYVILADLAELGDALAPLLKAVRVARGRHHHVLVIVPWPDDVPAPEKAPEPVAVATPIPGDEAGLAPGRLVRIALVRGYQRRYEALRSELARVGATVIRVAEGDAVRTVLDRLDRVRGARNRR